MIYTQFNSKCLGFTTILAVNYGKKSFIGLGTRVNVMNRFSYRRNKLVCFPLFF
jgi:hypothetical protein